MLIGATLASPITQITTGQETVVESRNDGFDQAVEVTSQEFTPASQQLIVEEQEQVTEAPVPVMPKMDLSQYMMFIPANQFRNLVNIPAISSSVSVGEPLLSTSVSVGDPLLSTSVSVGQGQSYGSSYGSSQGSSYGSSQGSSYGSTIVRNLSGVKGGTTIVRSESIKGLPPPPAARKTSSTLILP